LCIRKTTQPTYRESVVVVQYGISTRISAMETLQIHVVEANRNGMAEER
jgi:hypothetical protein